MDERVSGSNKYEYLKNLNFLSIQDRGNSQKDLLIIMAEILKEEFDLDMKDCGGSNNYLYIDDCIFTGNKFRYDIVPWIKVNEFNENSKLITYHIGHHAAGYDYAIKHISEAANDKNMRVFPFYAQKIFNNKKQGDSLEILWPSNFTGNIIIDEYYNNIKEKCEHKSWPDNCFRTFEIENDELFTSNEARDIVEKAFLKVGAKLIKDAISPSESMRPLGFEKLESLGFGSVFITYRNISNNCPLALWYGDVTQSSGPLSKWYPLLARKVNEN